MTYGMEHFVCESRSEIFFGMISANSRPKNTAFFFKVY